MLTDITLEVGHEVFYAHRVVLAAASPYFKAMFTGGLKECEMTRIPLQGVSPTAMARLIHFMYTGRIRVTENTVCQLLPAATMLQVSINFRLLIEIDDPRDKSPVKVQLLFVLGDERNTSVL